MSQESTFSGKHAAFCEMLKNGRESLGMTIDDTAKITELDTKYIQALERGDVQYPAPHAVYFLAGVYHISYVKLMESCGALRPNPRLGFPIKPR